MRYVAVVSLSLLSVLGACQQGPSAQQGAVSVTPRADVPTATVTPERSPGKPTPVVFAPGEVISRDDLGLFLLDPATGIMEGWPAQTPDGRCAMRDTTDDGLKLLFDCNASPEGGAAPNGDDATDTYALDLTTEAWTLQPRREAPYGVVAPSGDPLTVEAAGAIESVLSGAPYSEVLRASWAPDSSAFVVTIGAISPPDSIGVDFLIHARSGEPIRLAATGDAVWAADGSRFALVDYGRDGQITAGTIMAFDSAGRKLWDRSLAISDPSNPRWSPDSRWLGVQVVRADPVATAGGVYDLDVFDGASGEFAFRLLNAAACVGPYWTADNRLIVAGWREREIVNPRTGSTFPLEWYVVPSPTDPNLGISFDGDDFYAVELVNGSKRLIARTTVSPAWDFLHEPLFARSRIRFRPNHLGHGGCGEGMWVAEDSRPQLQFPPFPGE